MKQEKTEDKVVKESRHFEEVGYAKRQGIKTDSLKAIGSQESWRRRSRNCKDVKATPKTFQVIFDLFKTDVDNSDEKSYFLSRTFDYF